MSDQENNVSDQGTTASNQGNTPNNGNDTSISPKRGDRLFWAGLIVGLFVLLLGIAIRQWFLVGISEYRLILCAGIGILFGAFGSTATIKKKGVAITGVAATTLVILYFLTKIIDTPPTFGSITGDIKGAQIEIRGDNPYLGGMRGHSYDFVINQSDLKRPVFDVYIYFLPDDQGKGEEEIPFEGIDKKYIKSYLGSDQRIEWRFVRNPGVLVEIVSKDTIARLGLSLGDLSSNTNSKVVNIGRNSILFSSAYAQDPPRDVNFDVLLNDLRSGSPAVRQEARKNLADVGVSAIHPMMTGWEENPDIYRIQLGVLASLTQILRDDKNLASQVAEQITTEEFQLIMNSLSSSDRTVRIYAGEFLYYLGDPRTVDPALQIARHPQASEEVKYLSLLAVKGAYPQLSEERQAAVDQRLQSLHNEVGDKNRKLIEAIGK